MGRACLSDDFSVSELHRGLAFSLHEAALTAVIRVSGWKWNCLPAQCCTLSPLSHEHQKLVCLKRILKQCIILNSAWYAKIRSIEENEKRSFMFARFPSF